MTIAVSDETRAGDGHAPVVPLPTRAAYEPEPEVERATGWPLVAAWALMFVGSWTIAIAAAYGVWWLIMRLVSMWTLGAVTW